MKQNATSTRGSILRLICIVVIALALLFAVGVAVYNRLNPPSDFPDDAWFEDVVQYRTDRLSDSANVNAILERMIIPDKLTLDGEPRVKAEEKQISLDFKCKGSALNFMDDLDNKNAIDRCALLLFSLVGDVDRISVNLDNGEEVTTFSHTRAEWADKNMDEPVYESATTAKKLKTFFTRIGDLNKAALRKPE